VRVFDWRNARMRAESNIAFGILLLVLALLAQPFASFTSWLSGASTGPLILAVVGVAAFLAIARWRQRGAPTVYGLNTVAVALIAYAAVMLMSAERTDELVRSMASSRLIMVVLGAALIAMGYFLRRTYARRELEEPLEEPAAEPPAPQP